MLNEVRGLTVSESFPSACWSAVSDIVGGRIVRYNRLSGVVRRPAAEPSRGKPGPTHARWWLARRSSGPSPLRPGRLP